MMTAVGGSSRPSGDLVTITGVVKLINSDQSKKAREKSLFMVYLNANNVINHKARMNKVWIELP